MNPGVGGGKKTKNLRRNNNVRKKNTHRNKHATKRSNSWQPPTTTRRHKRLQKVNCSPKDKGELNDFTCYTDASLRKLRDLWNARHPDMPIQTNNTKEIHAQLTDLLGGICNKESCWLRQKSAFGPNVEEIKFSDSFAPLSPQEWRKNPNEWLSSLDIMKVMKQYEKAYKCFEFIGPSPIDFDTRMLYGECVWEELCHFNVAELLKRGKKKIGIIFNTDPHDKPGQHWISMFVNLKKGKIFFFDSTGEPAPKEIMTLVRRIQTQGKKLGMTIRFDSNRGVEHQYGNTECGIYSLYFIVHMLEDKFTEHYLKTHILKDEYMQKFRKVYFNDSL